MNVLYVIPYFVPAWSYGGPVKVSFDFAKELAALGHQVTVATTDVLDERSRNTTKEETIKKIRVLRFKNLSNRLAKNFNFYAPVGLKRWLCKNIAGFDLVHIHEFFTYQSIAAARICKKHNKPYIVQPHGSLSQVRRKSRFFRIKNFITGRFSFLALESQAIIALNEQEKDEILKLYPKAKKQIRVVPNGLHLDEFKGVKAANLSKGYGISPGEKVVAFIGRIQFIKGLDISLRALARIKDKVNFKFLIIGPDEGEKTNLQNLAEDLGLKDRVVFAGLLSGEKKLSTLKAADLSLLNSRSEGLPTTLLESAALGLPIVCSGESGLSEVKKFKAGFIVKGEKETAEALEAILKDSHLRAAFAQGALKLAREFELKKCAKKLSEIYRSLI